MTSLTYGHIEPHILSMRLTQNHEMQNPALHLMGVAGFWMLGFWLAVKGPRYHPLSKPIADLTVPFARSEKYPF